MKLEIEKAVSFLSNIMRSQTPSADKLTSFRNSLSARLTASFTDHWFPDRPMRGNGYRCVRIVNNRMDRIVAAAGQDAGLTEQDLRSSLPTELSIWIDPDEVSYRIGEDGSVGVIYSASQDSCNSEEEDMSLTSSDTGSNSGDSDVESASVISSAPHAPVVNTPHFYLSSTTRSISGLYGNQLPVQNLCLYAVPPVTHPVSYWMVS